MAELEEIESIMKDYIKRYFEVIEKNGVCKKSNYYCEKIERLEKIINQFVAR